MSAANIRNVAIIAPRAAEPEAKVRRGQTEGSAR
jgi:hypothetical protein